MNKKVIASLDVFQPNEDLLKYGVYAAKQLNAQLCLYSAQYRSLSIPKDILLNSKLIEEADQNEKIKQARTKLMQLCNSISEEWNYTTSKLYTEKVPGWKGEKIFHLIDEVKDQHPLLTLLTVKSNHNWLNELLGTPETKLAEETNSPVFLLPEDAPFKNINNINYLLEDNKSIEVIVREVKFLKGLINGLPKGRGVNIIYYFGENPKAAEESITLTKKVLLQEAGSDYLSFQNLAKESIEQAIEENIKTSSSDLFAFSNRDKSVVERLTSNDNTKRLILKAQIPVLVF